jgi:hypothetical protein
MECQDIRALLAFHDRPGDELDAAERAALAKHLESCPDCAAQAAAERSADQAIGKVMRDVPVPAEAKQQLLKRLADEKKAAEKKAAERGVRWKRWAIGAAAAVLLIAAAGASLWEFWPQPVFSITREFGWTQEEAQQHLAKHGLDVPVPRQFRYRYLQNIDIVVINGRSVAKLTFLREDAATFASAKVYIVDLRQFRIDDFKDESIRVEPDQEASPFAYVIQYRGELDKLRPDLN